MARAKRRARGVAAPRPKRKPVRLQPADPRDLTPDSLVRLEELQTQVPLSRTSIYRGMAAGWFPRPKRIGMRAIAWRWGDVLEWQRGLQEGAVDAG
ncbi:MAG: AlpA family phage regulatory protein [Myxococcota bacterium]